MNYRLVFTTQVPPHYRQTVHSSIEDALMAAFTILASPDTPEGLLAIWGNRALAPSDRSIREAYKATAKSGHTHMSREDAGQGIGLVRPVAELKKNRN